MYSIPYRQSYCFPKIVEEHKDYEPIGKVLDNTLSSVAEVTKAKEDLAALTKDLHGQTYEISLSRECRQILVWFLTERGGYSISEG